MVATSPPASTFGDKIADTIQWLIFICMACWVLGLTGNIPELYAPDAPRTYFYSCIGGVALVALLHLPAIFHRLPRSLRLVAYLAILPLIGVSGDCTKRIEAAYRRTPAGIKEAAQQAQAERQAAVEQAEVERRAEAERARAKVERDAAAQADAAEKQEALDAKKPEMCRTIVTQVVDGEKVIEINNVSVEISTEPNEILTCSGDAVTSRGNVRIQFGLVQTPQGKLLVSTRFP